jgi:hypothetical protein
METIEANSRSRPRDWALPAIFAALVLGLLVGVWSQRERIESGDLVGIVSVVGSITIALYTVSSNREAMRDQRAHDRAMQAQQFREERSKLHRVDAVSRVVEIGEIANTASPFLYDFTRLAETPDKEAPSFATTRDDLEEKLHAAGQATTKAEWFGLSGWTDEMQRRGDEVVDAYFALSIGWATALGTYVLEPDANQPRLGATDLQRQLDNAWDEAKARYDDLKNTLRAELAREPDSIDARP